jgi:septal ring factor EnvC (AmiA/AmiB activator)
MIRIHSHFRYTLKYCGLLTFFWSAFGYSAPSINQAKQDLNHLEKKIFIIQSNITKDLNTHHQLKNKLDHTLNKIHHTEHQQTVLKEKLMQLNTEMAQLQSQLKITALQLHHYQKALYQHLILHLHLKQEPYWKILFGAENPFEYYQRIELAQYLQQSEQTKLKELKSTEIKFHQEEKNYAQNEAKLIQLQKILANEELSYRKEQHMHQQKLTEIQEELKQKNQQLSEAKKNQANLKNLIQHLLKANTLQSLKPFTVLKHRLVPPIHQKNPFAYAEEHGLLFKADEGTSVHAVSDGKIVFSDWLNGYGYIVIIDHGWGFMTLYGNNQTLLKRVGESVNQGEVIAKVGRSGSFQKTGLYFEIRQRAKVISARSWFNTRVA